MNHDVHDYLLVGLLVLILAGPAFYAMAFERGLKLWYQAEKRPIVWAIVYLLLLFPVFPLFYMADRDGFTQTTTTEEPDFNTQLDSVGKIIEKAVNDGIRAKAGPSADFGHATVVLQDPDAHTITGGIFYADSADKAPASGLESSIEIRQSQIPSAGCNASGTISLPYRYRATGRYRPENSSNTGTTPAAQAQTLFMEYSWPFQDAKLNINGGDFCQVEALTSAAKGNVGSCVGGYASWCTVSNLARMVYFSAVTVTTLGYGDIVPIETSTRIMVTLEAVMGAVTIGLFLNALSRQTPLPEKLVPLLRRPCAEIARRRRSRADGASQTAPGPSGVQQ